MIKRILLLFLFLQFSVANAQKYSLGKVTLAELQEKVHPTDSSASAAVLFKKGATFFEASMDGYWQVVHETEYKIKIYKKEGYEYAQHEEWYYSVPGGDKLYYSDVYTYNLVDGKIEKTKIKSDD